MYHKQARRRQSKIGNRQVQKVERLRGTTHQTYKATIKTDKKIKKHVKYVHKQNKKIYKKNRAMREWTTLPHRHHHWKHIIGISFPYPVYDYYGHITWTQQSHNNNNYSNQSDNKYKQVLWQWDEREERRLGKKTKTTGKIWEDAAWKNTRILA